ncbi:MAG: DUF1501 domain-containing protein [Bacteroidetes bacterium]|nr:DUF1501 domain-containing protein [Bacteroidota bacterium]
MNRRKFLKQTGIITAGSILVPSFLRAGNWTEALSGITKKRLVVIQLSGGNDGLNTMIPYGMDEYYQNRTKIGIQSTDFLKADDLFAFNGKLGGLYDLYKKGLLSVINSVGYPNPNRSHFRSMDIWHTACNSDEYLTSGWLGRYLDNHCTHAYEGIEWEGQLSLALKGDERSGIALTNPAAFYNTIHADFFKNLADPQTENEELNYLYKVFNDTKNSAEYIFDQYQLKTNTAVYADTRFAVKLKEIATLIKSGIQTPVFYTSLSGFDTHVNQNAVQNRLLAELDSSISSFVKDLQENNLMQETTLLVFSEFGRRLQENASHGTDHGKANVAFVIDSNLSQTAFTLNKLDLQNLDDGDPTFKIDFRQIYADVLKHTLSVDPDVILKRRFDSAGLFV